LDEHWREACLWVSDNLPAGSVCLTPVRQQTFKWYAQRAEVVTWKDVPQDATGLHEWWRRRRIFGGLEPISASDSPRLRQLAEQYGFAYVVTQRPDAALDGFDILYENPSFVVLRL
jgi:hypothetical protein